MHDFWEVVYIMEGKIIATADERVYSLEEGQILFHKPIEFHRLRGKDGLDSRIIVFSFDAAGEAMKFFEENLFMPNPSVRKLIEKTGEKIKIFLDNEEKNKSSFLFQDASIALETLLLELYNAKKKIVDLVLSEESKNYRDIVRTLNENFDKDLSLNQIAEMCNMSVSNLKKRFALYTDGGVRRYFMHIKMRKAIGLCQDFTIWEISDALCFPDVNYFYTVFKREIGCTPKEYMNQHR